MGFKCGIIGLPNVGKSTLFNALTAAGIEAANYPFCTIEPNVGIVPVPDPRLEKIAAIVHPERILPTTMTFVDIAGLVKGASQGEGLGNQFLAHIRETQAVAHVVRCFDDPDVVHVAGAINPVDDVETINTELLLTDMETLEKALAKNSKQAKAAPKVALLEKSLLERTLAHVHAGKPVRRFLEQAHSPEEQACLHRLQLITAKPVLYIANVMEDGLSHNPYLDALIAYANQEGASVVPVCAKIESEIAELDDVDKQEFLASLHLEEPGLNRIIRAGHTLLQLQTFFTAGKQEVRGWTFHQRATAPEAAGVIHTDFQRGFIRAEVMSYQDFIDGQGEAGAKAAGKWRLEGKDYIVQDGDVMHFRFAPT